MGINRANGAGAKDKDVEFVSTASPCIETGYIVSDPLQYSRTIEHNDQPIRVPKTTKDVGQGLVPVDVIKN